MADPADNPGLFGKVVGGLPIPAQPSPFLDVFAQLVGDSDTGYGVVSIPDLWRPRPVGTIDPEPANPPAPLGSHTAEIEAPWHYALATANVSRQALRWSARQVAEYEGMVRSACDAALEAALVAELVAAATPVTDTPTDHAGALDAAESAAATGWGSDTTHLIVNPGDGPAVRRGQSLRDPALVLASPAMPAGTLVAVCASAVTVEATAVEFTMIDEPSVVGKLSPRPGSGCCWSATRPPSPR